MLGEAAAGDPSFIKRLRRGASFRRMPRRRPDAAYDRLGPEFVLARTLIEARRSAALTQAELAERMETTQSVVARLESGRIHPSTRTLEKIARATGTRLRISFDPA